MSRALLVAYTVFIHFSIMLVQDSFKYYVNVADLQVVIHSQSPRHFLVKFLWLLTHELHLKGEHMISQDGAQHSGLYFKFWWKHASLRWSRHWYKTSLIKFNIAKFLTYIREQQHAYGSYALFPEEENLKPDVRHWIITIHYIDSEGWRKVGFQWWPLELQCMNKKTLAVSYALWQPA